MSLEPKSAAEEVNTVLPGKHRFNMSVLHLPRNVYLLLFFTLGKGFQETIIDCELETCKLPSR